MKGPKESELLIREYKKMTVSNATSQLLVPITLWGNRSPSHCISSILLTNANRTLITGCYDGQICIWDLGKDHTVLTPRCLLFGHTAAVLCLANGKQNHDTNQFVSSSESGEMSLWDLSDGRCLETVKLQNVHTAIHTHTTHDHEIRFFCNGYYAEIIVIDGNNLEILFTLNSKLNPDWISAIHVLRPTKSQDDVVIGLSIAGVMKVWTLNCSEGKTLEPIFENESKPIRCLNALQLTCCSYNQRTLLIVCSKYWQIYDVGDFALLCSVENRNNQRWSGGDFLSTDRVVIFSDNGKAYLYKLPSHCIPSDPEFHKLNLNSTPFLYGVMSLPNDARQLCPPIMAFYNLVKLTTDHGITAEVPKVIIRGDSFGKISVWNVPEISNWNIISDKPQEFNPVLDFSLQDAWSQMKNSPVGIIDNLLRSIDEHNGNPMDDQSYKLTSSVYIPGLGRLICGREDGSIIIVSANQTIMLQLLLGKHLTYEDWPHYQILYGHSGRVNTLLYPHQQEERYEVSHLISGGVDFSVCLWDLFTGVLLHRFSVHAGEITQMFAPPKECSSRILNCICSVASDHSVALISLKERKCIMLASRHLFPISTIKWRPLDDFMVVGCVDGSVYVWQMETGHLDRVIHGMIAEEILNACDGASVTTAGDRSVNPALHLFRGLKHRNLAAIRQAAVRGLHNISAHLQQQRLDVIDSSIRSRSSPMIIQGIKTNPKDQESHLLFFDVENLIVQLLAEEYDLLSPNSLEARGLTSNLEFKRFADLSCSPETQSKLTGLLTSFKNTAESAAAKIQSSTTFKTVTGNEITVGFHRKQSATNSTVETPVSSEKDAPFLSETHKPLEVARLLLSLLHAWGLDPELDKICETKLGLLRPLRPVCFGMISKGGFMSLLLPTYLNELDDKSTKPAPEAMHQPLMRTKSDRHVKIVSILPADVQAEEEMARRFTSLLHWELSTSITTNHLLAAISMANTMMTMANGTTFVNSFAETQRRKLIRKLSRQGSSASAGSEPPGPPNSLGLSDQELKQQKQQVREGWSLFAALHCCLLPDLVKSDLFKRPLVDVLARRWQDRCIEIREAAQALLLAELRLAGPKGRRAIVEEWKHFLPTWNDSFIEATNTPAQPIPGSHRPSVASAGHSITSSPVPSPISEHFSPVTGSHHDDHHSHVGSEIDPEEEDEMDEISASHLSASIRASSQSSGSEDRRKLATSIILLGVIGCEYGSEITTETVTENTGNDVRRKSLIDGFGAAGNYALARKTAKALSYLVIAPAGHTLPLHTSLRRSAIDLMGRGFTVWEPYIDVSRVMMSLLEFCCCESDQSMIPNLSFGLPLTPQADSCRTSRHSLAAIADARPQVFITTLAKEVTRYNTVTQQPQTLNTLIPSQTIVYRTRPEILRNMESLIEKHQSAVYSLIIESTDIVLYCLDSNALKNRGLGEVFPSICRFPNVTHCNSTKRVAVGARNGNLAIYELKTGKAQQIQAAQPGHAITACSFAPDGKHLAAYCASENRVSFWSTAIGLFGLGNAQTKCVKWYPAPPMQDNVRAAGPLNSAKLVWVSSKLLILLFADGKEHRFSV